MDKKYRWTMLMKGDGKVLQYGNFKSAAQRDKTVKMFRKKYKGFKFQAVDNLKLVK